MLTFLVNDSFKSFINQQIVLVFKICVKRINSWSSKFPSKLKMCSELCKYTYIGTFL